LGIFWHSQIWWAFLGWENLLGCPNIRLEKFSPIFLHFQEFLSLICDSIFCFLYELMKGVYFFHFLKDFDSLGYQIHWIFELVKIFKAYSKIFWKLSHFWAKKVFQGLNERGWMRIKKQEFEVSILGLDFEGSFFSLVFFLRIFRPGSRTKRVDQKV